MFLFGNILRSSAIHETAQDKNGNESKDNAKYHSPEGEFKVECMVFTDGHNTQEEKDDNITDGSQGLDSSIDRSQTLRRYVCKCVSEIKNCELQVDKQD